MSDSIHTHTEIVLHHQDERDWKQFHNLKDIAISLSLEASEVLEHFLWRSSEEVASYVASHKADVAEEVADVYYCILLLCDSLKIDLGDAFEKKMHKNATKYPANKAKGRHTKYDKL